MNDLFAQIYSYFHGIWAYRWSGLVIAWLVAIPGWAIVYNLPDVYTSSAIMNINTKLTIKPLLEGLAVKTEVDSGIGALSSRLYNSSNLEKIINATDLRSKATSEEAMEKLTYDVASKLSLISLSEEESSNKKKKNKSSKAVYMLSFESRSPELAYQVVNESLQLLVENTLQAARTDTTSEQEFFDAQIAEYEKRLSEAEQRVADFTRENAGLMPGESGGYYNKLQNAQDELAEIRANLGLAESQLTDMQKQLRGEAPITGGGQQIEKLAAYRQQLQELLTLYTESHPDVQALRTNIADLLESQNGKPVYLEQGKSAELNPAYQDLKSNIGRVTGEISILKGQLAEQNKKVKALTSSVALIPEVEAKLARLNRDYELTNNRYLKLIERKELAQLAQAVGDAGKNVDLKIVSPPMLSEEPSGPDRIILMSIIFAAALVAGLAWGAIKFALQPTFIYTRQLDEQLGLPILGTVGLYMTPKHKRKRKLQLASYLMVFSLLVIAYGTNMYYELDLSMDDILEALESSEV